MSSAFLFSKLGHCPMTLHYYTFKSKALVKKVSINEQQCLRMGRVHIQDCPRTMAQLLRNPMRNNIRLRSRVGIKVEIHLKLVLHSISMKCTTIKIVGVDTFYSLQNSKMIRSSKQAQAR